MRRRDQACRRVLLRGRPLLQDSRLSITIDQAALGLKPRMRAASRRSVDQLIEAAVARKAPRIRESYHELRLARISPAHD